MQWSQSDFQKIRTNVSDAYCRNMPKTMNLLYLYPGDWKMFTFAWQMHLILLIGRSDFFVQMIGAVILLTLSA